jgi:hypothetical protein
MRDIYDLVRNGRGDRFFEEGTVPQDLYYITPQGHALKRMGPKGEDPNYQTENHFSGLVSYRMVIVTSLYRSEEFRNKRRFITWCTMHLEMSIIGALGD